MTKDYIYIKLCSNDNLSLSNLKVKITNKYNKIVFDGTTDDYGKLNVSIFDNEVYTLTVYSKFSIIKIPFIAQKKKVYYINISNNNLRCRKHLVTFMLTDKYNPNIKIKGGKMIIWQDIQSQ